MKIALFGGSFDPVHIEHVRLVRAAVEELGLDKIVIMPSHLAPHKRTGAHADGAERLEACRIAFRDIPEAEVSAFELDAGGTSFSYLTCRAFAERYPRAERYFLVGADMLENFFSWREPDDILENVTLVACRRGGQGTDALKERFRARFHREFLSLAFRGRNVSSTKARVALAFGKNPHILPRGVFAYLAARGSYRRKEAEALRLEKPERVEHSFRVALIACERARTLGIPEEKALVAAMLHDCGKYVPLSSPLLEGFVPPKGVPAPVLHQYTGAYLAEHAFGVRDGEILDAIRYHTSGKAEMTLLGKLIYLADLVERGRNFPGVVRLRTLFFKDIDACLLAALKQQLSYLTESGKPVYPLTEQAYLRAAENAARE